ncbi:MAG: hypothetical protein KAQ96_02255 [Thermoplasmata archaeon]|nr:hypothetical protein [Thermoplasmata archaeon]
MGNRIAGPSAGKKPSSKKKGSTRGKRTGTAKKGHARSAKRAGGPRSRKGWSGPAPTKQARGSNTTSPSKRSSEPRKEDEGKKGQTRSRAQATQKKVQRTAPDKRATSRKKQSTREDTLEETQEGPRTYDITMDETLHGPEKMDAFKSKADEMVVGERTVIHHAARYGIVRGMTWTVILSALLFWLPVVGPAIAGYVGGRKAGGPLRAIIAVLIPAMVLFVILAAASESMDMVPTGMVSGVSFDPEALADMPAQTIPLVAGLQQSIDSWAATPPDVMFIMIVFAIVGGALSSLRRREEETVIEKVGIPLGELKERVLKEQAEQDPTLYADPPSRWHPHQAIAGPVAAHDAFNELVEEVAQKVYIYMQGAGQLPGVIGARTAGRRSPKRSDPTISTGEDGPHYKDMVQVAEPPQMAAVAVPAPRAKRGRKVPRGATVATTTTPMIAAEAIVGDAEDWEVVNTTKGRRPVRVLRSPPQVMEAVMSEHSMAELEAQAAPPVVFEEEEPSVAIDLPEPPMYVEERSRGLFRGSKQRVVYPTVSPTESMGAPASAHGTLAYDEPETLVNTRDQRNYERLPIVSSIYESMYSGETENVAITGSLKSLEEPTIHDTMEASNIASTAARELIEMARFEEGPDMDPEEDDMPPESKKRVAPDGDLMIDQVGDLGEAIEMVEPEPEVEPPAPKPKATRSPSKPKAKSTARKVKHPTGSLRSRNKKGRPEAVYEEDEALLGVVEWVDHEDDHIEEEDLFNPRRLSDDPGDDDGGADEDPEEGSEAWAEEERIAALVREREEWDRL